MVENIPSELIMFLALTSDRLKMLIIFLSGDTTLESILGY